MVNKAIKKSRLGRGLDDLASLSGLDKILPKNKPETNLSAAPDGRPLMVKIDQIDPNPDQPRRDFNEKELESLSRSIKAKGIIEPLVVTAIKDSDRYELIAGERRLKAAGAAGLSEVPVVLRDEGEDPSDRLVLALLENLCREDLNPIEEAESFLRLEKDFGKTHQEIATLSGRERPTITNSVRLLKLPDYLQEDIRFARLSAGHGRAMLGLSDHSLYQKLRSEVISKKMTVRQTEALVRKLNKKPVPAKDNLADEAYYEALASSFTNQFGGLKVKINHSGKDKKIEIHFHNNEELEWLMDKLGVKVS